MSLKKVLYSTIAAGALAAAGAAGYFAGQDSEYRVQRQGDSVLLYSITLDKAHQLTQAANDFYLGDSDHNLQGVKEVAKVEGQQSVKPEIDAVREQRDMCQEELSRRQRKEDLVAIVEGAKVGAGNLMQGIKNAWYGIKYDN